MRKTISGLVAAFAVIAAGAAPAKACDTLLAVRLCQPLWQLMCSHMRPMSVCPIRKCSITPRPIAPPQYYYVEQGPTYTGPGNFAPRRFYQEAGRLWLGAIITIVTTAIIITGTARAASPPLLMRSRILRLPLSAARAAQPIT